MEYEYGIAFDRDVADQNEILHRGPMTKKEAQAWLDEWEQDAPDARPGMFVMIWRSVSDWKEIH